MSENVSRNPYHLGRKVERRILRISIAVVYIGDRQVFLRRISLSVPTVKHIQCEQIILDKSYTRVSENRLS